MGEGDRKPLDDDPERLARVLRRAAGYKVGAILRDRASGRISVVVASTDDDYTTLSLDQCAEMLARILRSGVGWRPPRSLAAAMRARKRRRRGPRRRP